MTNRAVALLFAGLAVAVEIPAVGLLFVEGPSYSLWLAPYAHLLAAANCRMASHLWNGNSRCEQDAVFLTAVCVPVFGPSLAWLFPRRRNRDSVEDAHAIFERFEGLEACQNAGAACLPDAWQVDPDQPVAMSFDEILQHGSLDHKRNAIRMLADFGGKRHLQLLREVLVSETGELRLCAFLELNRVAKPFEDRLFELNHALQSQGQDPLLLTALATVHRDLAESGLLDREMAQYHLGQAKESVDRAWRLRPEEPDIALARAGILCDAGEFEDAEAALAGLPDAVAEREDCRVLRARIAYFRRDFDSVRAEARGLRLANHEPPGWMECLERVSWAEPEARGVW